MAVSVNGPAYVQRNELFWLHCKSGVPPADDSAEFIVDGTTADTLRRYKDGCFSTKSGSVCSNESCMCSEDGRRYSIAVKATSLVDSINAGCAIKRTSSPPEFVEDTIIIKIIGAFIFHVFISKLG